MNFTIQKLPFGKRTNAHEPDTKIYEYLGEEGMRLLVSDHYDLLVESEIKNMFPEKGPELEVAKKRSADFFIQRMGGPDYFNQNRGKPILVRRHAPFKITPAARVVWLECYKEVLSKLDIPDDIIQSYWNWLHEFSNWMVNTPEKIEIDGLVDD